MERTNLQQKMPRTTHNLSESVSRLMYFVSGRETAAADGRGEDVLPACK